MKMNVFRSVVLAAVLTSASMPMASCGAAAKKEPATGNFPTKQGSTMSKGSDGLTRIKLSYDGGEAIVELLDNPASRDLVSMLPLTLKFSDYNNVEKIAYPPRKLSTAGASFGLTPSAGDFALYAPWGNLVAYYRGFRHSGDLVHLGRFTSGIEQLAKKDGEFSVRIEAVE